MVEPIVINTGPLITLDRIGGLDIPGKLPFDFICPAEVRAELDEGRRTGYSDVSPDWLRIERLRAPLSRVAASALDTGEAAVIQLALERGIAWVCIDEWKGRRAALAAGLKVTGVLGLLGLAKRRQVIQAVKPYLEKAVAAGIRYDPELVQRVLEAVGEQRPAGDGLSCGVVSLRVESITPASPSGSGAVLGGARGGKPTAVLRGHRVRRRHYRLRRVLTGEYPAT